MFQDFTDKGLGPGRSWTVTSQVTLSACLLAVATSGWCVQIFALMSGDADIVDDEIGWLVWLVITLTFKNRASYI
jgi:hypothetical protein